MCGICGVLSLDAPLTLPPGLPERMIGAMTHRGPDEWGAWRDESLFMGHARLSIIDLAQGQQPLANEDGAIWITFNGEIFNYLELGAELVGLGHRLRTRSDTEVIVHAYEQWGEECVQRFNGQFAFAIWDRGKQRLMLARDRFGIRPLFWTHHENHLIFASEVKALMAWPGVSAELQPQAVAEVFTYWVNIAPLTPFAGIAQLPAGHLALVDRSAHGAAGHGAEDPVQPRRYWSPDFLPASEDHRYVSPDERTDLARKLREKLVEAAVIRLRADVPVGAYLSGGLDSSTTAALIRHYTDHDLHTFSVGFADPDYDETAWQQTMARQLGTPHRTVPIAGKDIAGLFEEVVWHAETPILRTAAAPLYALSRLVNGASYKVVLTGEGADEILVGYNIFREAKVRNFWSRLPDSSQRSMLLTKLYPYLAQSPPEFLRRFYGVGLDWPDDPFFSHRPRWHNGGWMTTFLRPEATAALAITLPEQRLASSLPDEFKTWGPVARAQYLEMTTWLPGYLLSSQGDRMLMGHSVEGRFPFLDHHLAEQAATIPASIKLQSLVEKSILKESVKDLLPASILARPKLPYRAPDATSFVDQPGEEVVAAYLGQDALSARNWWQEDRVTALVRKWRTGRLSSVRENMAFIGILSAQVLARQFGPDLADRLEETTLPQGSLQWRN